MMKSYLMKAVLLVLLAGVALSAGAKPSELQRGGTVIAADERQGISLMVLARSGFAGRVLGPRVDVPISCAEPKGT